jgi:hypothetical protein
MVAALYADEMSIANPESDDALAPLPTPLSQEAAAPRVLDDRAYGVAEHEANRRGGSEPEGDRLRGNVE